MQPPRLDPALNNYHTVDLRVTITQPALWQQLPNLQSDTSVTTIGAHLIDELLR